MVILDSGLSRLLFLCRHGHDFHSPQQEPNVEADQKHYRGPNASQKHPGFVQEKTVNMLIK